MWHQIQKHGNESGMCMVMVHVESGGSGWKRESNAQARRGLARHAPESFAEASASRSIHLLQVPPLL